MTKEVGSSPAPERTGGLFESDDFELKSYFTQIVSSGFDGGHGVDEPDDGLLHHGHVVALLGHRRQRGHGFEDLDKHLPLNARFLCLSSFDPHKSSPTSRDSQDDNMSHA